MSASLADPTSAECCETSVYLAVLNALRLPCISCRGLPGVFILSHSRAPSTAKPPCSLTSDTSSAQSLHQHVFDLPFLLPNAAQLGLWRPTAHGYGHVPSRASRGDSWYGHIGLYVKTLHDAPTLAINSLFDSLAPVVAHFTRRSLCSRGFTLGTAASSRPLRTMLPGSSSATSTRFGSYTRVASPRYLADTLFTFLHHSTRPSSARSRPGLCAFIIFSIHCSCG